MSIIIDQTRPDQTRPDQLYFCEIKGKLGFGCLRLPFKKSFPLRIRNKIDSIRHKRRNVSVTPAAVTPSSNLAISSHRSIKALAVKAVKKILRKILYHETENTKLMRKLIDEFLAAGFNYFDTAHTYGKSEIVLRECLVKRYPRESFLLANKLSAGYLTNENDIIPLFELQLSDCGVDYFDFYMLHGISEQRYEIFLKCNAFEVLKVLKNNGKVRHIGISFHDSPELLKEILTKHPEIEFVQIQFNYADYNDPTIQSKANYEVCEQFGKPVFIMEPVKGGVLVNLPDEAKRVFDELHGGSYASYAIRYAASFPNVVMVLSGMNSMDMMSDNIMTLKHCQPLSHEEYNAINDVVSILRSKNTIPCTSCRYCVAGCPKKINIPALFSCYNQMALYNWVNSQFYYDVCTKDGGRASDCIKCGKCEIECPQHLRIRELLLEMSDIFEK